MYHNDNNNNISRTLVVERRTQFHVSSKPSSSDTQSTTTTTPTTLRIHNVHDTSQTRLHLLLRNVLSSVWIKKVFYQEEEGFFRDFIKVEKNMVVSIKQQILLVLSLLIMMFSLLAGVVNGQLYANSIMFSKVVHPKSSIEKEQLMIIVGEVTDTTVRILYEWAPLYSVKDVSPDLDDLNLYLDVKKRIDSILGSKNVKMYKNTKNDFEFIYLMMTEQERLEWTRKHTSQWKIVLRKTETRTVVNGKDIIGQVVEIRDREGPKVLQFDSLTPNTCYTVEFVRLDGNIEDNEEYATFCTVSTDPFSLTSNIRISAMSCNRLFEDHDTTTYDEFFIEHQDSLWDFVIHMGDQVYADWVYHEYFKKINPQASFDDLLNAFRYVYRNTWKIHAVQRMLRHGMCEIFPSSIFIMTFFT